MVDRKMDILLPPPPCLNEAPSFMTITSFFQKVAEKPENKFTNKIKQISDGEMSSYGFSDNSTPSDLINVKVNNNYQKEKVNNLNLHQSLYKEDGIVVEHQVLSNLQHTKSQSRLKRTDS